MHVLGRHGPALAANDASGRRGLRPFDAYRDLAAVADLIDVAFGEKLDPLGRYALADMRRFAHYGWLLGALLPSPHRVSPSAPGFVWVEDGRIVGNVSLRRASGWGGFLIGNVAVHPDLQGQGIGTALVEAALDQVFARRGQWVGLEVRTDNDVARVLYAKFGFQVIGEKVCLLRRAGGAWNGDMQPYPGLRRGRAGDAHAIATIARTAIPDQQRALLEFRKWNYILSWERTLDSLLERRREMWWVAESDGAIQGALWVVHELRHRADRMEIFVHAAHQREAEAQLVQQGLDTLHGGPRNPIETSIVAPGESTLAAFEQAGFRKFQVLTQMRLNLEHQIPVRHR